MARLIDADALKKQISAEYDRTVEKMKSERNPMVLNAVLGGLSYCDKAINATPTADALLVPCKVGDLVWAIRNFKGVKHPQTGVVSDMYFTRDMRLQIVVKYVARGEWGKTVFATCEETMDAINGKVRAHEVD